MPTHKKLTDSERVQAIGLLQGKLQNNQLPHGEITRVANHFGVSRQSIHQLWKKFSGTGGDLLSKSLENVKRKTGSGRPPKYDMDLLTEHVQAIPLRERMTVRDLAAKLSIPSSSLYAMMQQHDAALRSHTSALKPELKEQNTLERVMYAH